MTHTGRQLQRAGLLLGLLLAIGYGIQQFPTQLAPAGSTAAVSASAAPSDPLAAPAQSALDQILGPGHSVVTASASYAPASTRLTTSYQSNRSAPLAQAKVSAPGYTSTSTQNGVGQSVTRSVVPGGQIQRLTVAVVVDSALRPAPKRAVIRQQVSAALGLRPSRGDTLSVVALPLPSATTAGSPPALSGLARVTPYLKSGFGALVAMVLLLTWRRVI